MAWSSLWMSSKYRRPSADVIPTSTSTSSETVSYVAAHSMPWFLDVEPATLSYVEVKALASGNPKVIDKDEVGTQVIDDASEEPLAA